MTNKQKLQAKLNRAVKQSEKGQMVDGEKYIKKLIKKLKDK